ncbi:hypothetical protein C1H46_032488 [Malus baccata]|uniref:Uncharacterized protein n=1 Tax=Malus baccata TaxID=106549 RepID=A0A540L645_MALBA|nr:hypothetical protein C1H46_032488 [Malus baccata]
MHLRALFAQRNDNSVGVTRSLDISLVFAIINSVYCYYPSPSVVYPSAVQNRAVHQETEAMAEEKKSDYEYPEREATTEEKPDKDEYPYCGGGGDGGVRRRKRSTAQNIAAATAELFHTVNDDESETDIEGWVPVPPLKPSDIDKVVVSDDKFERYSYCCEKSVCLCCCMLVSTYMYCTRVSIICMAANIREYYSQYEFTTEQYC